jgi:parallel beta-helix repeat protein
MFSAFQVRTVKAVGTIRILSDGRIDPPWAAISTSDNVTYSLTADITDSIVIERNNTIVDGAAHRVMGDGTGNGLKLCTVSNVVVKNTNIQNFEYGIYVESSTLVAIKMNNITLNSHDGIGLFYVSNIVISGNRINENGNDGIEMYGSSYNNMTGNHISSNAYFGIEIYDSSNNRISENRIADNYNGIELAYTSSCSVIHNDFINHTLQVSTVESITAWDNGYPSGGNYWSDHSGIDIHSGPDQNQPGSDGIGDTPYNCGESNQDRYPLMQKWTNIAITAITCSKTAVVQGQGTNITAVVQNQGWDPLTTGVTLYANTTVLTSFTNIALQGRSQVTLNFTWQTASFDKAQYVISANANTALGEPDSRDNTLTYPKKVAITVAGDVNGDGVVDIYDAIALANAYSAVPTSQNWNANADINSDNIIDIYDAIILANNYGKKSW